MLADFTERPSTLFVVEMIKLKKLFESPYGRLLLFVLPHWRIFFISIIAMCMLASTEWMLPALLKPLIDESLDSTNTGIRTVPFLLVVLFLFRGLFSYISTVSLHLVAQKQLRICAMLCLASYFG